MRRYVCGTRMRSLEAAAVSVFLFHRLEAGRCLLVTEIWNFLLTDLWWWWVMMFGAKPVLYNCILRMGGWKWLATYRYASDNLYFASTVTYLLSRFRLYKVFYKSNNLRLWKQLLKAENVKVQILYFFFISFKNGHVSFHSSVFFHRIRWVGNSSGGNSIANLKNKFI